jgi:hypothetical protein
MGQLRAAGELGQNEHLLKLGELVAFKGALTRWLRNQKPHTLGQILIAEEPCPGLIFTHYTNWFCKGLPEVSRAVDRGKRPVPLALAYAKLDDLRQGWRIECRFHHDHLTSASSWSELSGQKPLLVLGLITDVGDAMIEAIPYVIANPVSEFGRPQSPVGRHWFTKLEIHPDTIDSFDAIRDVLPPQSKRGLEPLKEIPEAEIKAAFAEIVGEPMVPKDWGGERSDLFTGRVVLEGKRISTAFVFRDRHNSSPWRWRSLVKTATKSIVSSPNQPICSFYNTVTKSLRRSGPRCGPMLSRLEIRASSVRAEQEPHS